MDRIIKNAGWIIGCKVAKALLSLLVTMMTARYLGASNYGLINYAAGIVAFMSPFVKLGLDSIAVYEIVRHPGSEGETIGTIMALSMFSSILCILGILGFTSIVNQKEENAIVVCLAYSFTLFFQAAEMIQYWFQAKLLSKYSSLAMLVSYFIVSTVQIIMIVYKADIVWFAISYSIDYLIITVVLVAVYGRKGTSQLSFSLKRASDMLSVSRFYIISSLMVTVFNNTDRVMLKLMVGDRETGIYAAANSCAGMTSFIFTAIIDSMRSVIFRSKESFEKNIVCLYSIIIYFSFIQCIAISIFSPWIIKVLYGESYQGAGEVLRVAVWFTTFSYLGAVRNIWILANNFQRYLWKINLSGAVMNVLLNLVFIPRIGALGAAVASVISQFFTNILIGYIIPEIRKNNNLMLKAIAPRTMNNILRIIRRKKYEES